MHHDSVAPSNIPLLPKPALGQNLSTHVQSVLLEAILGGNLAPGERLLVDEVAAHFGISKIPVREAFKALEVGGWLEVRQRRGTFVKPLSAAELRETFEMRRVLEPYSARMAAQRRSTAQLAELGRLVLDGGDAIASGDLVRTTQINSRFHTILAEAANNSLLGNAVTELELRMRRYFIAVDWQQREESLAQHRAIYEAIREQDADAAERLTIEHLAHTESVAKNSVDMVARMQESSRIAVA